MKLDAKAWFAIILILFFIISGLFAVFSPPTFVTQQGPQGSATPSTTIGPYINFEGRALFSGEVIALTPELVAHCITNNSLQVQQAIRASSGVQGAIALGSGTFRIQLSNTTKETINPQTRAELDNVLSTQCTNYTIGRTALITINDTTITLENPQNTSQNATFARRLFSKTALLQCVDKTCGFTALVDASTTINTTLSFVMVAQVQNGEITTLPFIGQAITPPTPVLTPTTPPNQTTNVTRQNNTNSS